MAISIFDFVLRCLVISASKIRNTKGTKGASSFSSIHIYIARPKQVKMRLRRSGSEKRKHAGGRSVAVLLRGDDGKEQHLPKVQKENAIPS